MNRLHLLDSAILLLALAAPAAAQQRQEPSIAAALQENIQRAGINTHCYEFAPIHDTKAPKGYKPFYISHYGRHGSRSDWGASNYRDVALALDKAKEAGILTPEGDSLRQEAWKVFRLHDGMDGRLTQRGVREHAQLAENMYKRFPQVFRKGNGMIRAYSLTVQRCIISMTSFTNRLNEMQPSLEFQWDTGERFMDYISNGSTEEIDKASAKMLDELDRSYVPDTASIMRRLFTDPQKAREFVPDALAFEHKVFQTAKIADSFDVPENLYRHLPFDAVYKWSEGISMLIYMRQCNSVELGSLRMATTEPLVRDFVEKADEVIEKGNWTADLRFGHDFPLLAFVNYLGLEGVGDRMTFDEARVRWRGWENIPFASNFQAVFYRNKGGDVLVKFLYNEKETLLRGLQPVEGPYYRWSDVKTGIKGYLR